MKTSTQILALTLLALALSACAQRSQIPVSSLGDDDDAICHANNVAVGSPEYVACRKDRDVIRSNAAARADRRQRDLGEYMLNHPDHP
jgi:DICT domain-containing protein